MSREIYLTEKDIERFWSKVDIRGEDECWEWKTGRLSSGYGNFSVGCVNYLANRVSLTIKLGRQIKPKLFACHSCDNPPCCNPNHLFEWTHQRNVDDKTTKGRQPSGELHWTKLRPDEIGRGTNKGTAKLDDEKVLEIRALWETGKYFQFVLAKMYDVDQSLISYIVRRKIWTHI